MFYSILVYKLYFSQSFIHNCIHILTLLVEEQKWNLATPSMITAIIHAGPIKMTRIMPVTL